MQKEPSSLFPSLRTSGSCKNYSIIITIYSVSYHLIAQGHRSCDRTHYCVAIASLLVSLIQIVC